MGDTRDNFEYSDYQPPLWANRYFWLSWVLAAVLTLALWYANAVTGVLAGLAALFLILMLQVPSRQLFAGLILYALVVWMFWVVIDGMHLYHHHSPAAYSKQNLHAIQLALERYATDHGGKYPIELELIRTQGYLPKFPQNAYREREAAQLELSSPTERETNVEMTQIAPDTAWAAGWASTSSCLGDILYLPDVAITDSGELAADGYRLCVFIGHRQKLSATYSRLGAFWLGSGVDKMR